MNLIKMITMSSLVMFLAACGPKHISYAFHNDPYTQVSHATIFGKPGFGKGLIIIRNLDGKNTANQVGIAERVRRSKIPLLLPSKISVSPGNHKVGALFLLTDISKKLASQRMTKDFEKMYLSKQHTDPYVSIRYYAEFNLNTRPGFTYYIGRSYDRINKKLSFTVHECGEKTKCVQVAIQLTNEKTSMRPGWATG